MENFFASTWQSAGDWAEVRNPYSGDVVDVVPQANSTTVDQAISGLVDGAAAMRQLTGYQRGEILDRVCKLLAEQIDEFALCITSEAGKTLRESRGEVQLAIETLRLSAEEARRLAGDVIPLDGAAGGAGKIGFTLRVPCGIVAAISPFNFPLNLVAHKIGPAIAGGNAVLLKPASATPLTALKLTELLLDADLPETAIACITGSGSTLGKAICGDDRVRKISFTGSYEVGAEICRQAGMKKVTMELGGNGPVIVMDDADLKKVAAAVAISGYANAGQVCISTQRVLVARKSHDDFLDAFTNEVRGLKTGDPQAEQTSVGPLIRTDEAERVDQWVKDAVSQGARLVTGGDRHDAFYEPAIIADINDSMKIATDELFGPAVGVAAFDDLDEALQMVNKTQAGLACGIFTQDIDRALKFARQADSGNININATTQFRVDQMPYGGVKQSGLGKEGPGYAIREMTEEKMITFH